MEESSSPCMDVTCCRNDAQSCANIGDGQLAARRDVRVAVAARIRPVLIIFIAVRMTWSIALLTLIMAAAAFYLSIAFVLVYIAIQFAIQLHWTFLVAGIVLLGVLIVIWVRALKG